MAWILKMAWRDSRGSRRRLLLFLSSMVLGVAALVAINSFGENMERAVDDQARTLLGADLSFESDSAFPDSALVIADSLGGEQSLRVMFASMAFFPKNQAARLASIRAVDGGFPFYGELETLPAEAGQTYQQRNGAVVDQSLLQQVDATIGDTIRIGQNAYPILGQILQAPRESEFVSTFSPRVYLPLATLDSTLLSLGSRAEYELYFKFDDDRDVEETRAGIAPRLREMEVGTDTVEEVKNNWNEGLTNLYRFLSLLGFIALLLGGLGVASAVHVYVQQRIETVGVLRCLGASARKTFGIYLTQATGMGVIGGLAGCLVGLAVQLVLPSVLDDFLPVDVEFGISWSAMGLGFVIGLGVTLLFALKPLIAVRRVSPLVAIRSSDASRTSREPLAWLIYGFVALGITAFAVLQSGDVGFGLGYAVSILAVFGMLALVAKLIIWLTRKYFPQRWTYVWRQGLANLYRPNNQTLILMLSVGLGTFLILTLFLVQRMLLSQINLSAGEGQPNLVLFDIQPDQRDGVKSILEDNALPIIDDVSIVTMRLAEVKGRTIDEIRADTSSGEFSWAHRREYRSTYRDRLTDSEELTEGEFIGTVDPDADIVPVSVESDIMNDLSIALGDTLVWNVQGVNIATYVSSVRKVDWQQVATNFFVVFPSGVLDGAPQFNVVLSRTPDDATSATVQSAIVADYPNVSAIDVSLILSTFEAVFDKIAFVIRFMALFSILTGFIVLAGAVIVSRFQRVSESVLLKTLGASKRQVFQIMTVEYLFLGLFATMTGAVLSIGGSWALAVFVFDMAYLTPPASVFLAIVFVTALTIAIGLLNSRGIYNRPPLEVLRAEA
ncbi:MAG: FtsX-like permease family protein [Bacteroidota bacterium]